MTEIEQLRKDIATLKAARVACERLGWQKWHSFDLVMLDATNKLAILEAEATAKADPWTVEKSLVKGYLADLHASTYGQMVAKYAQHLEQRVAELEEQLAGKKQEAANFDLASHCLSMDLKQAFARIAELKAELLVSQNELAKRPVVWCVRNDRGEIMKQSAYDRMAQTIYHFDGLFPSRELASRLFTGETELYTGQHP